MARKDITLSSNIDDGDIEWLTVVGEGGVTISGVLASGAATMTPKRRGPDGSAFLFRDADGNAYSFTSSFDLHLKLRDGDVIGLGVSGATTPTGFVRLTGRFVAVD